MKREIEIWLMLAAVILFAACRDYEADAIFGKRVNVPLAFTFSSAMTEAQTRQSGDALIGTNRGITIQRIVPLIGQEPDGSEVSQEQGPYNKTSSNFYYYQYCSMTTGVDHCLVYGKAQGGGNTPNATYGWLNAPTFPFLISSKSDLQGLSYSLASIYDQTEAPSEAWQLADALTDLANVDDGKWRNSTNAVLQNLFKNFINHEFNLPGSAASVKQWMKALKAAANDYYNADLSSIGDDERAILQAISGYIINDKINDITYPRDKELPDGAAALRWTTWTDQQQVEHTGFKPVMQTTTLDNINSVSRFAYPAALYYFVNSTLRTSDEKVDFNELYTSKDAWSNVLADKFSDEEKTRVTTDTKAVALTDPVQYAVAQLIVALESTATLATAETNVSITVGSTTFPLRGVIVCGQRPVDYLFKQSSNSDAEVKFIYDPQVKSECYLSTTKQENAATTLVLQSFDNEDVNIILEFENNSDQDFKCLDGTVYRGTRFYLIGQVVSKVDDDKPEASGRVFTKGYTTTVNMKVTSLEKAYNVLPNLLSSNLEIGVETTPQWVAATPTDVRLDE